MVIQFRNLASAEGPIQFRETLNVESVIKGRRDLTKISPLEVNLQAYPSGEDVVDVYGNLTAELSMSCSRCLKPLTRGINIDFKERFVHGTEPEEEEMDDDVIYVSEDSLDLIPYVEESLLLNLPFAVVCKDDCKGLCPVCGTDRNERDCNCDTVSIDPRLAGLKDFFK